jgi:photosystem II stability/assembly factor-like uncharacterized protein
MIRSGILILVLSVILFLSLAPSCKKEVNSNTQEKSDSWEVLTNSPLKEIVPIDINIIFFDVDTGISQGMSAVRKTTDGGKTWDLLHNFEKTSVSSLVFTKNNVFWSVGSTFNDEKYKPVILNSDDRGVTWQQIIFDKKDSEKIDKKFTGFSDICFDPTGKSWIIGSGGIVESLIKGQKFEVTNIFLTKEELYSVSCSDEGDVWAVGNEGAIYHFQNDWKKKERNKDYTFEKVKLIGYDVWLLGYKRSTDDKGISGILLKSTDRGNSWEDKTPANAPGLNDLHLKNGIGWLIGDNGSVYYSDNNGDSWEKQKSLTKNNLSNIYYLDTENIWIGGANQTILRYKANSAAQ